MNSLNRKDINKEIVRYVVEIMFCIGIILIVFNLGVERRKTATEQCNISDYEAYRNTKVFCDLIGKKP